MGLFKKKGKNGTKCPACGSLKITAVKGTQAVMAYPGFYSGVANNPEVKETILQCKDCKIIFKSEN